VNKEGPPLRNPSFLPPPPPQSSTSWHHTILCLRGSATAPRAEALAPSFPSEFPQRPHFTPPPRLCRHRFLFAFSLFSEKFSFDPGRNLAILLKIRMPSSVSLPLPLQNTHDRSRDSPFYQRYRCPLSHDHDSLPPLFPSKIWPPSETWRCDLFRRKKP